MKPANYPVELAHLWQHFYQFTQIPRPSGKEAAVRQYVIDQAEQSGCSWRMDTEGNVVVSVAASVGMEQCATVIIQNHLDMVTVKTSDKDHDFHTQPLQLQLKDGWLSADRTTLGADNGVGCAAALALMTDTSIRRPPLELLFTVDEETGLGGALRLDPGLLSGSLMLNLDTEDWQELFVGCTGGGGWEFSRRFTTAAVPVGAEQWLLSIKGLAGGHSGIQIHEQLGNAIKLLGQALQGVEGVQLAQADVGVAHNVIPREGQLGFAAPAGCGEQLSPRLEQLQAQWLAYLPAADSALEVTLQPTQLGPVLGTTDSQRVLDLVSVFPHGPQAYNLDRPAELVDLSINLARLKLDAGQLLLESSFRFFNEAQSMPLRESVLALARSWELQVESVDGYPGWQPDFDSSLLERASVVHEELFGLRPAVKAIHAGLECGILKGKKPDMDILSFGPTIRGAHSPTERLQVDTVGPFWQFLTTLLERL